MTPGDAPRAVEQDLQCGDFLARAEPERRLDRAFDDVRR